MDEKEFDRKFEEEKTKFSTAWESILVTSVTPLQRTMILFLCFLSFYFIVLRVWWFQLEDFMVKNPKDIFLDGSYKFYGVQGTYFHLFNDVIFIGAALFIMLNVFYPTFKDQHKRVLERIKKDQVSRND
ncbi:MAG TPA: hypothetical protein VGQ59_05825 [Cyclobacteriaceae bacterium]|jgi:uncharacterized membrane protein YkgB|nr:hypothetical protein [Cyclobacteriaceae bacterium]